MSFIPEVKVDFIPSDDEEEIIEEKYEEAEKLKVSFESESESEEEEEEIKQEIFTKPEPKKKEPNLTKSGKPRKKRPPMSDAHKEKLKFAREKAMAVRKKNAEERKQMKSVDKEEKELLKKQKIKRVKKLKEEVEEDETPKKKEDKTQPIGITTFSKKDLEDAQYDAILKYDAIRKQRKKEKQERLKEESVQNELKATLRRAVAPPQKEYNPFGGCY